MTSRNSFEDIKRYLPQYLSPEAETSLFADLSQFPDNIDSRMYTTRLASEPVYFQGDGVRAMPFVNIPDPQMNPLPALIISNTCDISPENPRLVPMRVMYAPIFNLLKFNEVLRKNFPEKQEQVSAYVDTIRHQKVSNVFYLPAGAGSLDYEGMVPLDRIQNAPVEQLHRNKLPSGRFFTLGNYGWYILLFKLSIHFSRIREGVIRN